MTKAEYLEVIASYVGSKRLKKQISREYGCHIDDCRDALLESGLGEDTALERALEQTGNPHELGRMLKKVYYPKPALPAVLICLILVAGFMIYTPGALFDGPAIILVALLMACMRCVTLKKVRRARGAALYMLYSGIIISALELAHGLVFSGLASIDTVTVAAIPAVYGLAGYVLTSLYQSGGFAHG